MQDPNTMTFSARAQAKDDQIRSIETRETNETRLKKELKDTEAARAKDEAYLVQLALADAAANQRILERYAHHLPPPAAPAPAPVTDPATQVPVPGAPAADAAVPGAADSAASAPTGEIASQPVP